MHTYNTLYAALIHQKNRFFNITKKSFDKTDFYKVTEKVEELKSNLKVLKNRAFNLHLND